MSKGSWGAGRIKSHVMPDYEKINFDYYDVKEEKVVRDFLSFFEHMGPDLLCFCTLWTGETLNQRASGEHTHFYHEDQGVQQAGHYHGDVTPGEVHYAGYLNTAESIWRFGDIYEELGISV